MKISGTGRLNNLHPLQKFRALTFHKNCEIIANSKIICIQNNAENR